MFYLQGDVVTDGKILKDRFVEITNDKITYVGTNKRKDDYSVYKVRNGYICPGFIDIHIHGINGSDFMDQTSRVFSKISDQLPKYGVTSFLATSRTAPLANIEYFLEAARREINQVSNGARIRGVHLEGPWISPKYSGAQNNAHIRTFTWEDVEKIIVPYFDIITKVTLAPEKLEESEIIHHLISNGIDPSAGHTDASIEKIDEAVKAGLRQITHTFNAMSPLHHRAPGTAGAALYYDELICEVITDGVHTHPKVIELLHKVKGKEHMALISDCTGYNELPDGEYTLRGKDLIRSGNEVRLKNGQLAGSAITLDKGIKYSVKQCHIPLEEAVYMATATPAKASNCERQAGKIRAGCSADIVLLNEDLDVEETIINGQSVYAKGRSLINGNPAS